MKQVNLDHAAAAPLASGVLEAMLPYYEQHYGNPSSGHELGKKPVQALGEARESVGHLIGAAADEIIFTASASESNNLVLKGLASAERKKGNHIITSAVEHFSVLNPLKTLQKEGYAVTLLPVDQYGRVDPAELADALTDQTILISIQYANPEIGTVQPIKQLAAVAADRGIPFHTDAAAACGWIPIDVQDSNIGLLTLAGDQFYGPKGSAALYLRRSVRLRPLLEGGTQERGLRAGTENVPAIVGLGEAARQAYQSINDRPARIAELRDQLRESLFEKVPYLYLNGDPDKRLPQNLNFSVRFVEGEALLMRLNMAGIFVSSGSSCTSHALKSSHVLSAIGVSPELAQGSLLFTLGIGNSIEEIPYITDELVGVAELLRSMSPLYHQFMKEG